MLIQPSSEIPKDLREPEIPGRTEPQLPSGEWGINRAAGGRIPSLAEWRSYISTYAGLATESAWCWAADSAGTGKRWAIYPATGETKALRDLGFGGDTANGYGIR
ncbi:hypothetical protein C3E98_016610 [Pseudomonas sp. MWU13-2625]|nr:hypothetical protein C3E98_016610 [Pseudomonas sp. MWU13-2625]